MDVLDIWLCIVHVYYFIFISIYFHLWVELKTVFKIINIYVYIYIIVISFYYEFTELNVFILVARPLTKTLDEYTIYYFILYK